MEVSQDSPEICRTSVSLQDVLKHRRRGLSEAEAWSVLCQSAQTLQDIFLTGGSKICHSVPVVTPSGLNVTAKGRILFLPLPSNQVCLQQKTYTAPEFHPQQESFSESQLEKMWIYSVGVTIKNSTSLHSQSHSLQSILKAMTHTQPENRASLMDLLDVISEYCKSRGQTKPFSHVVMDLYNQVTSIPNTSNAGTWPRTINVNQEADSSPKVLTLPSPGKHPLSTATCPNRKELKQHPVQRAPSRLYRVDSVHSTQDKYHCPTTCIGPEFVVRAANPPRIMHLGDVKPVLRRKLVVILLNGQKLDISCDPSSTTATQIFEVVVDSEGITENFTLGLAMLVSGDFVFLPPDIRLCKVAPSAWSGVSRKQPYYSFTLYLRFKFYLPSLRGSRSWNWKHLLYLQLRRCLLERQLRCETKEVMSLAGLALQAEFGDYNYDEHGCGDYFLLEHYLPEGMWREGECVTVKELQRLHRERRGLDPGRAEELFIANVQRLPEYGTHYYSAISVTKDHMQNEVWLGVSGDGISVSFKNMCSNYAGRLPSESFHWRDIKKLCYNKQYFELTTQPNSVKFKFKMDTNKSFCVFRFASQHHKFFLKLRTEMSSIQNLAQEFGVPVKRNEKDTMKTVYYVGGTRYAEGKTVETKPSLLRRSASFFSPERVIFRGRNSNQCAVNNKQSPNTSGSTKELKTSTPEDNESGFKEKLVSSSQCNSEETPTSLNTFRKLEFSGNNKTVSCGRRGLGVRMGTRTFLGSSNVDLDSSLQSNFEMEGASSLPPNPMQDSTSSVSEYSPAHSPLPEAYVLNSSIKTEDERFHVDFRETISESLAEKFKNIPFVDERILTTVRLCRDENGSIGIQIIEGCDGGVYIQSVTIGGSADKSGLIHRGDQIQAVNGKNILSVPYNEALRTLQETGSTVELVLSQVYRGQEPTTPTHSIDYTPGESSGMDLHAAIVQKPIEESYFRVIRYETATEAEGKMIDTALPKTETNKSNVFLPHKIGSFL
uniref:FERM domain-containing protein n=1 Tax=Clastoptera arizonana TaxID=38151 RepID=A0A1B6CMR0_9HEMI